MINIVSTTAKLSSLPPAPDKFTADDEEDSDRDSEEEEDVVQLLLDESGYPLLPPQGSMPLEKSKTAIHMYWMLTYRASI